MILKKILQKIYKWTPLFILGLFSFVFTAYVLLNAYEQIFFKDIPYIETLRIYNHSAELSEIVSKIDNTSEYLHHVVKDTPRYLTIPSISTSIELTPSLFRASNYYVRGNKGLVIKKTKSNTMVVYLDENWRTTTDLDHLQVDELLFVLSYDYNYIFKIDSILINNPSAFTQKIDDTHKPSIVVVGEHENMLVVVSASLVNSVYR